jgi:hypothetical protein
MDKDELKTVGVYLNERWKLLDKRETEARFKAQYDAAWGRISNLPVGASVVVNAEGNRQLPRGTIMKIKSFNSRGRKSAHLQPKGKDNVFTFSPYNLNRFDIHPAGEIDLSKFPNVMHVAL